MSRHYAGKGPGLLLTDTTFWTELVKQIPGILIAIGVCCTAIVTAYVKLKQTVQDGNDVATATHKLVNSRFDEWKRETLKSAADSAIQAANIASQAALLAYKDGVAQGRADEAAARLQILVKDKPEPT